MSTIAEQLAATKARWAQEVAARRSREAAQKANYRANEPIPLYGIGKGMSVAYAPGQMPGASRTQANGREISGYWDPRTNQYVPANWTRPQAGQWVNEGGRSYYGGDAFFSSDPAKQRLAVEAMRRNPGGQGVVPGYGGAPGGSPGPGGQGAPGVPPPALPGNGQLPGGPPAAGGTGAPLPYVGSPGGTSMPMPGQGGRPPTSAPAWWQQIQAQQAQAQALRGTPT